MTDPNQIAMQVLQAHEMKLEQISQQLFIISTLVEYILDHVVDAKDASGEPLIPIDLDKFEDFVETRKQEILQAVEEMKKAAKPDPETKEPEVDLNE